MRENNEHEQSNVVKKNKKKYVDMNLPGYTIGVRVPGNSSRDIEMALRKFKRIVKDSGIMEEYRARQEYIKPSMRKRKQKQEAIRKKDNDYYVDE